jgi:hypothetical protein
MASTGGTPNSTSTGKVTIVPAPTTEFMTAATVAARRRMAIESGSMGFLLFSWREY